MIAIKLANTVSVENSSINQYAAPKIIRKAEIIIVNTLPILESEIRPMNAIFIGIAKTSGRRTSSDSLFLVLTSSHDLNANIPNMNIAIFTDVGLAGVLSTIYS